MCRVNQYIYKSLFSDIISFESKIYINIPFYEEIPIILCIIGLFISIKLNINAGITNYLYILIIDIFLE